MITLELLRERATDDREIVRGWIIASRGITCESRPNKIMTTLRSSDAKENYAVWITAAESWCDCVAFARSRKRMFCKHVAALALSWLSQGDARQLPGLQQCAPTFADRMARLSVDDMRAILTFAASEHKDVYGLLMR